MRNFEYARVETIDEAVRAGSRLIAGGTEQINLMKEGIDVPRRLIDINAIPLASIEADANALHLGALARMSDVAAHADVARRWPAISQALLLSASPQLRNMASMGGNLMQRTRCPYFRAETQLPCNKRAPGSGCAARNGENRGHAIFGWSDDCVATHPSDLAVALSALDARVRVRSARGERTIALVDFHRLPGGESQRDTVLESDEMIAGIDVPASRAAEHSHYIKVRERASYEFALVSAAAGVDVDREHIREARLALGGVAHKPWRMRDAEQRLAGVRLEGRAIRAAIEPAFADARPLRQNGFKVELAMRTAVRALLAAGGAQ